jgi:hypothetical protein
MPATSAGLFRNFLPSPPVCKSFIPDFGRFSNVEFCVRAKVDASGRKPVDNDDKRTHSGEKGFSFHFTSQNKRLTIGEARCIGVNNE